MPPEYPTALLAILSAPAPVFTTVPWFVHRQVMSASPAMLNVSVPPAATVTVSCALKDAMSASVTVSDSPDATTRSSAPAVAAHAAARKSTDRCLLIAFVSFCLR